MIESLKESKLKVTIGGEKEICLKYGTKVLEALILAEIDIKGILAVRVNNSLRTLDYTLVEDSDIKLIDIDDSDGYRVYIRTVKFLLHMALKRLYPTLDIEVCNTIDGVIYFICRNQEFTDEMADNLLEEMRAIVKRDSKFERVSANFEEAKFLFELKNDDEAISNISHHIDPRVTLYFSEDAYGLTGGVLAPSASLTPEFEIKKFRRGFALMVPRSAGLTKLAVTVSEHPLYRVFEENDDFLDVIGVRSVNEINDKVINGTINDIIKVAEAGHANKMAELMNDIKTSGIKRMFLIAGPSSSGKTTFANKLCVNLKLIGYNPIVISMDNYFKERVDTPKLPNGEYDFETIDALDLELFNRHMADLFNGKTIEMPEFNFMTGEKEYKGSMLTLGERDVLILEGIHALNPLLLKDVDEKLKYKIYIAPMTTLNLDDYTKVSTTDTRMLRRIVRDYYTRGHGVESTLKMWPNLKSGETKYIYPNIKYADYIYNTSLVYEIGVLRTFAEPLLLQVDKTSRYFSEARRLYTFIKKFLPIGISEIPNNSIVREFINPAIKK